MSDAQKAESLLQRGLKLSHLRLMAQLGETGHLGLSAGRLGITQPAASRLLAEVEQITQATMHSRTGRGIALTELGQVLARRAQRVMMEMGDAAREMAEVAGGGAGVVRIGAVTAPALDMVLPALRTARLSQPKVRAEVSVAASDILCGQLLDGRLDFALGRIPKEMETADLSIVFLGTEPIELVVRRGHRLAGRAGVPAAELMEFDWVMPAEGSPLAAAVQERLAVLSLGPPRQHLATSSFLLTLALVQQTNAIAPVARAVARQFANAPDAPYTVVDCPLGIDVAPFGMITRTGADLTPAAQMLVDLMLSQHRALRSAAP